jgi:hypothetical protein
MPYCDKRYVLHVRRAGILRMQSKVTFSCLHQVVSTKDQLGRYVNDDEPELSEVDSDDEPVPYIAGVDEPTIQMPPPNPKEFCQMPIRDQFAYVRPVIKAILNETYLPARERHQAFMQGGPSRLRLRKTATGKGHLTSREVSRFGRVLQHWVLGPILLQKATPLPSSLGDSASESGVVSPTQR